MSADGRGGRVSERLCLVVNPRSAAGRTADRLGELEREAGKHFEALEIRVTEGPGHATILARQALKDGARVVAAVGGDGTASEVVNGFFEGTRPIEPEAIFAVIPAGTGSDLVKTLKVPRELGDSLRCAAHGETRPSDVATLEYTGHDGRPESRICVNVFGLGMNGEVVRRANRSSKRFGGTATFLSATLQAMATYAPPRACLDWVEGDGRSVRWEGPLMSVFLANGQYCGGGMWVGRGGSMQDGLLDLVLVPKLPLVRQAFGLPRLFTGDPERVTGIIRTRVREFRASAESRVPVLLDVDGEQPGALPLRAAVLQGVLKIRGVWV